MNSENLDKLKVIIEEEKTKFLANPQYKPRSLRGIHSELGIARRTITKYAKEIVEPENSTTNLYARMYPHNDKTPQLILDKLRSFIEEEKERFQKNPSYTLPTHEAIGHKFGLKRKVVEKYTKKFVDNEELYFHMWTLRTGKRVNHYKKHLKRLIYQELTHNNKAPRDIIPEKILQQLGEKYITEENRFLVIKYIYIIYYLVYTKVSTWKIGKQLSPLFHQTSVSIRSMALKISNLLEREIEEYNAHERKNSDHFSELSQSDIQKIQDAYKIYRRYISRKKVKVSLEKFESDGREVFIPKSNFVYNISTDEYREIKEKLKIYRGLQKAV